jgi:hypothetical protein
MNNYSQEDMNKRASSMSKTFHLSKNGSNIDNLNTNSNKFEIN